MPGGSNRLEDTSWESRRDRVHPPLDRRRDSPPHERDRYRDDGPSKRNSRRSSSPPRRRESPERRSRVPMDRIRDTYIPHLYTRRGVDTPEPGQIPSSPRRNRLSPERRTGDAGYGLPQRPKSAYQPRTSAGGSTRGHSRNNSRDRSPGLQSPSIASGSSVTAALDMFSKIMHTVLIATSSHALSTQHLSRLTTFPYTDSSSSIMADAQNSVDRAEKELHNRMVDLQAAFAELMKRTLAKPGVADGDVSAMEMEALKERMVRLEEMSSGLSRGIVLPSTSTSMAPQPPHTATDDIEILANPPDSSDLQVRLGKRQRAREVLNDVIARVEKVEGMETRMEDKIEEVENQMNVFFGDLWEKPKMTWNLLEGRNKGKGKVKEVERKNEDEEMGWDDLEKARDPAEAMKIANGAEALVSEELRVLRAEVDQLKADLAVKPPVIMDGGQGEEVRLLKGKIEKMESDREANARGIVAAVSTGIRNELEAMVKKEITKVATSFRTKMERKVDENPNATAPTTTNSTLYLSPNSVSARLPPTNGTTSTGHLNQPRPSSAGPSNSFSTIPIDRAIQAANNFRTNNPHLLSPPVLQTVRSPQQQMMNLSNGMTTQGFNQAFVNAISQRPMTTPTLQPPATEPVSQIGGPRSQQTTPVFGHSSLPTPQQGIHTSALPQYNGQSNNAPMLVRQSTINPQALQHPIAHSQFTEYTANAQDARSQVNPMQQQLSREQMEEMLGVEHPRQWDR